MTIPVKPSRCSQEMLAYLDSIVRRGLYSQPKMVDMLSEMFGLDRVEASQVLVYWVKASKGEMKE